MTLVFLLLVNANEDKYSTYNAIREFKFIKIATRVRKTTIHSKSIYIFYNYCNLNIEETANHT